MGFVIVVEDSAILTMLGQSGNKFLYESWNGQLEDERTCALGTIARQAKQLGSNSGNPYSRDRNRHICKPIGEGVPMHCFTIINKEENWRVWNKGGGQLFGIDGRMFERQHTTEKAVEKRCCRVMAEKWNLVLN